MRRLFIPAVVALALASSACSPWRETAAATVNGTDIDADALQHDARTLMAQPDLAGVYLGSAVGSGTTTTDARLPTAVLSALLTRRVSDVLVRGELEARGITVSDADRQQMLTDTRARLTTQEQQSAQGGRALSLVGPFDQLPEALRDRLVASDAASAKLRATLADHELAGFATDARSWYQSHQPLFVKYCLSTIPVQDQTEAAQVAAQANAANLQQLVSSHGGQDAGCGYGYQLQQAFDENLANAIEGGRAGQAVGPFEANDGSLVLVAIMSRDQQAYEDVQAAADSLYLQDRNSVEDGPWKTWLAAQKPEVDVDPRYGTWDAAAMKVQPPAPTAAAGSPSSNTTSPSTTSAPAASSTTGTTSAPAASSTTGSTR